MFEYHMGGRHDLDFGFLSELLLFLETAVLIHGALYVRTKNFWNRNTLVVICLLAFNIVFTVHLPKISQILCYYGSKLARQVKGNEKDHFDDISRFHHSM